MITQEAKWIAQHLLKAFGWEKPKVQNYTNADHSRSIDILSVDNTPEYGITSYSTIWLSDTRSKNHIHIELCGATTSSFLFANILSEIAFQMRYDHKVYTIGSIASDIIPCYEPDTHFPFLYFTAPFFWEDTLSKLDTGIKEVYWLMCFPISWKEKQFIEQYGYEAFETMLEHNETEVFNIHRPESVR